MRVAIDASELGGRPTGVGRYLRELIARWTRMPACDGSQLLLYAPFEAPATLDPSSGPGARTTWRVVGGARGTLWQQRDLARAVRADAVDVFFAPAYTAPLRLACPTVVSIHDVSFAARPEWYAWTHGLRLRLLARLSARRARAVLTLTRFSAAEITGHLGVSADRIHVVPLAVDYLDAPPVPQAPAAAVPVVLFVGSIFERRHLPLLIEATALARRRIPGLQLDVIGENRTSPRQDLERIAHDAGAADVLRLRDYVSDADLAAAYASASVFAFLSEYEGFGLTPLEAMRGGLPAIVLDTPVAREVYGAAATYVPLGDAQAVADALTRLVEDPVERAARIAAGDALVAGYKWNDAARRTWDVVVAAGGQSTGRRDVETPA